MLLAAVCITANLDGRSPNWVIRAMVGWSRLSLHFRFTPKAEVDGEGREVQRWATFGLLHRSNKASLDNLISGREQRRWNCQPERRGGFRVDSQRVFRRSLHREIARLFAL